MLTAEEAFRRLAIGDRAPLADVADPEGRRGAPARRADRIAHPCCGSRAHRRPQSSYQTAVEAAMRAGATLDDLLATLVAVAGSVGSPRVVSAAPRIALAAGYDIDAALEATEAPAG